MSALGLAVLLAGAADPPARARLLAAAERLALAPADGSLEEQAGRSAARAAIAGALARGRSREAAVPETAARLAGLPTPSLRPGTRPGAARAPVYRLATAGRVVVGTGERGETGWRARGLTLATDPDAPVVAPALGRVAYAGAFGGYGRIVILDHGHGWTTLLAGLGSVEARAGALAPMGSPLGRMGAGAPRLLIELRHAGRPVDAAEMAAE